MFYKALNGSDMQSTYVNDVIFLFLVEYCHQRLFGRVPTFYDGNSTEKQNLIRILCLTTLNMLINHHNKNSLLKIRAYLQTKIETDKRIAARY